MRVLNLAVHGSWTNALVRGAHTYLLPAPPTRTYGLGRGRTWSGRESAVEVRAE